MRTKRALVRGPATTNQFLRTCLKSGPPMPPESKRHYITREGQMACGRTGTSWVTTHRSEVTCKRCATVLRKQGIRR